MDGVFGAGRNFSSLSKLCTVFVLSSLHRYAQYDIAAEGVVGQSLRLHLVCSSFVEPAISE